MSRKPTYRLKFRRRRESRTDYYSRIRLLSSSKTRLVARVTNSQIIAQLVDYTDKGDKTLFSATSRELRKHGWKGGNNIPGAYLTGLLLGTKAKAKVNEAILDIGLRRPVPGSRVFAVAKGLQDAGININIGEVIPSEDRLGGKHVETYAAGLSDEDRKKIFSSYIKSGLDPSKFSQHVEEVRSKIGGPKPAPKPSPKPEKKEEKPKDKPKSAPKKEAKKKGPIGETKEETTKEETGGKDE